MLLTDVDYEKLLTGSSLPTALIDQLSPFYLVTCHAFWDRKI